MHTPSHSETPGRSLLPQLWTVISDTDLELDLTVGPSTAALLVTSSCACRNTRLDSQ
jgi:hypothetical protein